MSEQGDDLLCAECQSTIPKGTGGGRPLTHPRYCSNACRQRAYRRRSKSGGSATTLNSFVGRVHELVELDKLLRTTRLLTLTGSPGIGKTRLAAELAAKEGRRGRSEIVLVDLAASHDGDAAAARLADDLNRMHEDAGGHAGAADRSLLLVLDNCDRALDACGAMLNDLFLRHPTLRVLATSREPFRHPSEVVHSLGGLLRPGRDRRGGLTEHLRSDAVRLFVDRARAVAPGFVIDDDNSVHIATICERLEGVPLALELAAQLVRVLPLVEVVRRLDDPVAVLTGGWRTLDRRHRGWRQAIAWSYETLRPAEQAVFRRLSAIVGGVGVEGAVAMVGADLPAAAVPELLDSLAAKSLVVVCPDRNGLARFRVPESLACYGRELLRESGEEGDVLGRLTAWLCGLAVPVVEDALCPERAAQSLADERDNLMCVLTWLSERDDERRLLLAAALTTVDADQGPPEVTRTALREALAGTDPMSRLRPVALAGAAVVAAWEGNCDEAAWLAGQAVRLARIGEQPGPVQFRLLLCLSTASELRGDFTAAIGDLYECQALARRIDSATADAVCASRLAWLLLCTGDLAGAQREIEKVLPDLRDLQHCGHAPAALHTTGTLALERGDVAGAEKCYTEMLRVSAGRTRLVVLGVQGLAICAVRNLRFESALELLAGAEECCAPPPPVGPWWRQMVGTAWRTAEKALPVGRVDAAIKVGQALAGRLADHALGVDRSADAEVDDSGTLSQREWDVVGLVVEGLSNRQIAARMFVSVRTVETHMTNIRAALGLRSRAHVAAWASRLRSLPGNPAAGGQYCA
jgi:predicted ATPase/DNA-binding CsgD family transcriptional regulator